MQTYVPPPGVGASTEAAIAANASDISDLKASRTADEATIASHTTDIAALKAASSGGKSPTTTTSSGSWTTTYNGN